jgi:hypothetical protein
VPGPGEYRPDPAEGITRVDDLPKPNVGIRSRNYRRRPCPRCGHSSYRDRTARRSLHDLGDTLTGRPRDLIVLYSQHYCTRCRRYFNADLTDLAEPGSHYTRRVVDTAVRLVVEDGLPFVTRRLRPSERATLRRISRGLPQLRTLRELMEEVYRLFDRRCRLATALGKLARLRARLRRFGRLREVLKKLLAPGLEKSLVFLDERLLGATSNAVERGNRRYRKMQKTVYRVRTRRGIEGRLALDLQRERQGDGRSKTTLSLHKARAA